MTNNSNTAPVNSELINSRLIDDASRRKTIKQLAAFCGLALSASSLELMATSSHSEKDITLNPQGLLNTTQFALVRQLGEIIIPTTETPGAIGADVHSFINHFLLQCSTPQEQQQFVAGLTKTETATAKIWHKKFLAISHERQITLLTDMEKGQGVFDGTDRAFFKQLKGLVIFGYYTSEIGATQELAYLAIPGGYKGDVKFNTVGKAWAF